jgi:hypothetical protein
MLLFSCNTGKYEMGGMMAIGGEMGKDEGKIGGLTADESIYLYIKKAISQPSREKYLRGANLWKNAKAKEVELSLIKKGYLNNIGSINEIGKKKIKEIDTEIGYMLSSDYIGSIDLSKEYKRIVEKFNVNGYAKGGELDGGSNLEMLRSTIKEIEHHVSEMKRLLKKDMEIEAWVVAKAERSTTDLSDITHYLDGLQ